MRISNKISFFQILFVVVLATGSAAIDAMLNVGVLGLSFVVLNLTIFSPSSYAF